MARPAGKSVALWVLRRLRDAGFEALFAGGCVRDMLLRKPCADYDVATNATPQQVKKLFDHVLLVGAKFGVAMVIHRRTKVEVTTFRSDISYSDGRRPDQVVYTTAREDALRRDFTINGMFYDPIARQVIDYVGGKADLKARLIRTIGDPAQRFAEDYLRMLRAVRFGVRLGFAIDPATAAAVKELAPNIASISGERVLEELSKMLTHPRAPQAMELLRELGLAQAILPELFARQGWDAAMQRVARVASRRDLVTALGALLGQLSAGEISQIIRRWGGSNQLRKSLGWLAEHLGHWQQATDMPLNQFKRLLANKDYDRLAALWSAQEHANTGRSTKARKIARRKASIPAGLIAPKPFVSGEDLLRLGLRQGPALGRILKDLYNAQLNEQIATRAGAIRLARQLISQARPAARP